MRPSAWDGMRRGWVCSRRQLGHPGLLSSPALQRGPDAQRIRPHRDPGLLLCEGEEKPDLPALEGSRILVEEPLWPKTTGKPSGALQGSDQP